MTNDDLVERFRASSPSDELKAGMEALIAATATLRQRYPPENLYRIDFGEKAILREVLAPDEHDSHWWQTGLHLIRAGSALHKTAEPDALLKLDQLKILLEQRLGPYRAVSLQEITSETVNGICLLSELMEYPQNTFVAPNSYSLAQALFSNHAWYRAVYAGKAPVGFLMLYDNEEKPEYYLWRFMIAPHFQKSGFGGAAIQHLIDYVRSRPHAKELLLSYIDHEEGPADFYRQLGFVETGEIDEGEVIMRLEFET